MHVNKLDFLEIYDSYHIRILRYLVRLVGEHDAEDLTQEVFVKISQALQGFRGESQLSTWIYRIASNVAIDKIRTPAFRGAAREESLEEPDAIEDQNGWMDQDAPLPDQQLMQKEMYACFIDYVKNLPVNYRMIIVLGELEGLANKEIAEILGLSIDVVKIRLHRGRALLFQKLKTQCKAEDWL